MFLFRILLLPFTLIGMAFALFGVSTRVLLLPLRFVARNPVLSIVLVVGLILYLAIKRELHPLDQLKPAPARIGKRKRLRAAHPRWWNRSAKSKMATAPLRPMSTPP